MIEVILLERIERLGSMGAVVKVKPGYARNYLLPKKKALRATKENMALFEKQRAELEARNATLREQAEKTGKKIEGLNLIVIRQASETGQLYGSVSARDVAEAANEAGEAIERSMVQIESPIKALGLYPVRIKLHPDVAVNITINVARSPEEAQVQKEKSEKAEKAETAAKEAKDEKAAVEAIGSDAPKSKTDKENKSASEETGETKKEKKPRSKKAKAKESE